MQIRIYESKNLDLDTVSTLLFQADRQVNFHPEARWILYSSEGETKNYLFNSEERIEIVKKALFSDLKIKKKRIKIISFKSH